jgi:hypothetical protein
MRWPKGIPFQLPDENQTSSPEPLSDSRKNLITWNGIDTSGPELDKPTLGNPYPFRINVRVRNVQGAKEGVNHYDALFYGERRGLLNDILCAVHKTPP